jgi:hypothetical protein
MDVVTSTSTSARVFAFKIFLKTHPSDEPSLVPAIMRAAHDAVPLRAVRVCHVDPACSTGWVNFILYTSAPVPGASASAKLSAAIAAVVSDPPRPGSVDWPAWLGSGVALLYRYDSDRGDFV